MAWIKSKKVFSILNGSEEGKDIIKDAPDLSDEELEDRIDDFFKNSGSSKPSFEFESNDNEDSNEEKTESKSKEVEEVEQNEYEPLAEEESTTYKFELTKKTHDDIRKKFRYVFRKSEQDDFDDFYEALDSCSSEQKALFIQAFYDTIDNVYQGKGEAYFSGVERKIILDRANLTQDTQYVKNGPAFHEFGHAIDYTIGRMTERKGYASYTYVGEDGLTMEQALDQDVSKISWDDIQKDIEAETNQNNANELDLINKKIKENDKIYDDFRGRIESARKKKIETEVMEKFGVSPSMKGFGSFDYSFADAHNEGVEEAFDYYMKNYFYSVDDLGMGDELNEIKKTGKELRESRRKILDQKTKDWGDVSDICSGYTQNEHNFGSMGLKGIGFGHSTNYWKNASHNRIAMECFAEMYQGITVNPRSYAKMKKYFPKAAKVFEEIISKYGKGVKQYE